MKILFISTERPQPGFGAGERSLSICRALRRIGELHTLVVVDPGRPSQPPRPAEHVAHLRGFEGPATSWYFRRRKYLLADERRDRHLAGVVARLHEEHGFDAFFGRYHLPVLAHCAALGPTCIDLDDVPQSLESSRPRLLSRLRRARLRRSLAPMRRVFVTKASDVARVEHPRVEVLPCISTQPEENGELGPPAAEPNLLFVGGLGWGPNREGLERFVTQVLPRIRARVPGVRLRVVGENRDGPVAAGDGAVDYAGFLSDLAPEYRAAAVVVVPIRTGTGSCVKLAEAAGFGRPVVATPHAALGYEGILQPGRDLLVAERDEELAEQCVGLLRDPVRSGALAAAARATARARLSQAVIDRIVSAAFAEPRAEDAAALP